MGFAYRYFDVAFPLLNLKIDMNRQQAIRKAETLSTRYHTKPGIYRHAVSFDLDETSQNFIELENGGHTAFLNMIKSGLYAPYTWRVRQFQEENPNEVEWVFTPDGTPYGFKQNLAETEPGPNLPKEDALAIAKQTAEIQWDIRFKDYELIETAFHLRANKRADHTFVFERRTPKLQNSGYRLRLVLKGNTLTELTHFIEIPETFQHRYEGIRSANETIATIATVIIGLVYLFLGCVVSLFFLAKSKMIQWKFPVLAGVIIAGLNLLATINEWPLLWFYYDTAMSTSTFILNQILGMLSQFLLTCMLLIPSFIAAESLTRKAFPQKLQFWKLWSPSAAGSPQVIGQTIGGYLAVGLDLAFIVGFYLISTRYWGWWNPTSTLTNPDVLATYLPWLNPVARALKAGFWEECLFRAVPLASAAIIGRKFGRPALWVGVTLILQALIFGAAHANYPGQPAYARMIELIIPSLVFGWLYLRFGLLPAILAHFAFDSILMSLPIFHTEGNWGNKAMVILTTLIPLFVVLYYRLKCKLTACDPTAINQAWRPQPPVAEEAAAFTCTPASLHPAVKIILPFLGGIGLLLWGVTSPFKNELPKLTLPKSQALVSAKNYTANENLPFSNKWNTTVTVKSTPQLESRFIWQESGKKAFQELMESGYLEPPHWIVRFARFSGTQAERETALSVQVLTNGRVANFTLDVPETLPGAKLNRQEGYTRAVSAIGHRLHIPDVQLEVVNALDKKLPDRRDWIWIFKDTGVNLKSGEARIQVKVTGNQVTQVMQYVYVPEKWMRAEKNKLSLSSTLSGHAQFLFVSLFVVAAIFSIYKWSQGEFDTRSFMVVTSISLAALLLQIGNQLPILFNEFKTSEPLINQLLSEIGLKFMKTIFSAFGIGLVAGMCNAWRLPQIRLQFPQGLITGIGLGAFISGILSLIFSIKPHTTPIAALYTPLSSSFPILGPALMSILPFFYLSTVFLFFFIGINRISHAFTIRKTQTVALCYLFGTLLASMAPIGYSPYFNLHLWLLSILIYGTLILAAYLMIFRYQTALIPITIATFLGLKLVKQAIFQAYPGTLTANILGMIALAVISVIWYRRIASHTLSEVGAL